MTRQVTIGRSYSWIEHKQGELPVRADTLESGVLLTEELDWETIHAKAQHPSSC